MYALIIDKLYELLYIDKLYVLIDYKLSNFMRKVDL